MPRTPTRGERTVFSRQFACPVSGFTIEEIEPRLFSFNTPHGACPACDGLGVRASSIPSWWCRTSGCRLAEGAVAPWPARSRPTTTRRCKAWPGTTRSDAATPWQDLPAKVRDAILHGTGEEPVDVHLQGRRPRLHGHQAVRGRAAQPRAPLAGDRQRLGARGAGALPGREALRGLQRRAAEARGAGGAASAASNIAEASELSIRARAGTGSPAVHATLTPQRAGDRPPHPARDQRAAAVPGRCRARLPDPGARLGHAVRRREPAHPPGQPDRLGPDRRALRAGRAVASACTSATTSACWRRCGGCATSATPCWSSSTTRRRSAPPTI